MGASALSAAHTALRHTAPLVHRLTTTVVQPASMSASEEAP